jgi:hypothetical protein
MDMNDHTDPTLALAGLWFDFANAMQSQYETWCQQADLEHDPALRRLLEQVSHDAMACANSARTAADHLMRETDC